MSGDARDGAWSIHVGTVLARPPPFSQRGHTFAWCEATNRTVLPVCIPYNQLRTTVADRPERGVEYGRPRGRPDWVPALSRPSSEIMSEIYHAKRLNRTRFRTTRSY